MKKRADLEGQYDLIAQMAFDGATRAQIAEAAGTTLASMKNFLRRWEIQVRRAPRTSRTPTACERNHETVKSMAEAGATLDAIGAVVGTTPTHVRKYLTREGIQRPAWREPAPGKSRRTDGALNSAWKGGRQIDKSGYVLLWMPGHPEANRHGQVREHRIVAARTLGRPLTQQEVVDHINGDTGDNRPENLRVFPSNGEHLRATLTGVPCPARANRYGPNRRPSGIGDQP